MFVSLNNKNGQGGSLTCEGKLVQPSGLCVWYHDILGLWICLIRDSGADSSSKSTCLWGFLGDIKSI